MANAMAIAGTSQMRMNVLPKGGHRSKVAGGRSPDEHRGCAAMRAGSA